MVDTGGLQILGEKRKLSYAVFLLRETSSGLFGVDWLVCPNSNGLCVGWGPNLTISSKGPFDLNTLLATNHIFEARQLINVVVAYSQCSAKCFSEVLARQNRMSTIC